LAHLQRLGDVERGGIERLFEPKMKLAIEARVTRQQARFEQRGLDGDVALRLRHAFGQGADAGADLESRVPAIADERLDLALEFGILVGRSAVWHQHQHVDIGIGEQFAAAESTDGQQRERGRKPGPRPQVLQGGVGLARQALQQGADAAGGTAAGLDGSQQPGLAGAVVVAQLGQRQRVRRQPRQSDR
jgi:hypothetical protein